MLDGAVSPPERGQGANPLTDLALLSLNPKESTQILSRCKRPCSMFVSILPLIVSSTYPVLGPLVLFLWTVGTGYNGGGGEDPLHPE